jgi:hypothetical protein
MIYNLAVPQVGEIDDEEAEEFVVKVVDLVRDAVEAHGDRLW